MPDDAPSENRLPLPSRYTVQRELGSGGMATVYLAHDAETGSEVAVKVLRRDLAGAVAIGRFLQEIRLTHEISHPNILPVLDSGDVEGIPYLVMPVVAGESLRARLDREGPLPLTEALRIATAIAEALHAAHARDIVHRDVKPGNILLHGEQVYLSDFGIARALSRSTHDRLTESGLSVGTAGYMSPEQASGESTIDRRSDLYSLACVVYEMLAGEPPFNGPTAQAIIAKQVGLPAPSILVLRPRLPEPVDDVLARALAKTPADRFADVREFTDALATASRARTTWTGHTWRIARRHKGPLLVAGAGLVMVAFGGGGLLARAGGGLPPLAAEDSARFAVFPIAADSADARVAGDLTTGTRGALLRWTDLSVVEDAQVAEALARHPNGTDARRIARAARALRAGRYIRGELRRAAEGRELRLVLVDGVASDSVLAEAVTTVVATESPPVAAVSALVDQLLLGPSDARGGSGGTRSLAARRAHAAGFASLRRLALARADSAFTVATALDPRYASAQLGLAMSRLWRGQEPARWRLAAEQAVLGVTALDTAERVMVAAVSAHARDDAPHACRLWRALEALDPREPLAPLGAAHCLATDDVVVKDARSPSGWSFRSSYHQALLDYQRAFRLEPAMLGSFASDAGATLRKLFRTDGGLLRQGRSVEREPRRFSANMTWAGDSLAYVPFPKAPGAPHVVYALDAQNEAVRRQRELLRAHASYWVSAFPASADAHHLLAMALAALGDPAAVDVLAQAATLVARPEERLRVASADVALQLAFALRDGDTLRLRRVRRLADSLLQRAAHSPPGATLLHTSLAALTGRANAAALSARSAAVSDAFAVPRVLRETAAPLLLFAALGGPADSLRLLEERMASQIAHAIPPPERVGRRMEFLARAASMAFPLHRFIRLDSLAAEGDPLVALQALLVRGDTSGVRRGLQQIAAQRRDLTPETLALDALAPEAALWLALGDPAAAAAWVDPTLAVLPQIEPGPLASPLRAASLVRTLLVRAEAAEQLGDVRTATLTRSALRILLSDADPFLRSRAIPSPSPRF